MKWQNFVTRNHYYLLYYRGHRSKLRPSRSDVVLNTTLILLTHTMRIIWSKQKEKQINLLCPGFQHFKVLCVRSTARGKYPFIIGAPFFCCSQINPSPHPL